MNISSFMFLFSIYIFLALDGSMEVRHKGDKQRCATLLVKRARTVNLII